MLEAARRLKCGEPIIQRRHPSNPNARFLFSLSPGETVDGEIRGRRDCYVYRKAQSTEGVWIHFASHSDARPSKSIKMFKTNANTLPATKVTVDPLGRIHRAFD
jgi:hypothetical protein